MPEGPSNVRVALRVRPAVPGGRPGLCLALDSAGTVTVTNPYKSGDVRQYAFDLQYDAVASGVEREQQQEKLYQDVGLPMLRDAFDGVNSAVLAYGASGTGKSYAIGSSPTGKSTGDLPAVEEAGLLQRFVREYFSSVGGITECIPSTLDLSCVELYNERAYDLLSPSGTATTGSPAGGELRVREHPDQGPYVENLTVVSLPALADAERAIRKASAMLARHPRRASHVLYFLVLRQTYGSSAVPPSEPVEQRPPATPPPPSRVRPRHATTLTKPALHTAHSMPPQGRRRSSLVTPSSKGFINDVRSKPRGEARVLQPLPELARPQNPGNSLRRRSSLAALPTTVEPTQNITSVRISHVTFCDLSGTDKGFVQGAEKEASGNLYKSISCLSRVISLMSRAGTKDFVPYRESLLTWLLKDKLGGNCRTTVLATVSPAAKDFDSTLATLQFAAAARKIQCRITTAASPGGSSSLAILRELTETVAELQRQREYIIQLLKSGPAAKKKKQETEQPVSRTPRKNPDEAIATPSLPDRRSRPSSALARGLSASLAMGRKLQEEPQDEADQKDSGVGGTEDEVDAEDEILSLASPAQRQLLHTLSTQLAVARSGLLAMLPVSAPPRPTTANLPGIGKVGSPAKWASRRARSASLTLPDMKELRELGPYRLNVLRSIGVPIDEAVRVYSVQQAEERQRCLMLSGSLQQQPVPATTSNDDSDDSEATPWPPDENASQQEEAVPNPADESTKEPAEGAEEAVAAEEEGEKRNTHTIHQVNVHYDAGDLRHVGTTYDAQTGKLNFARCHRTITSALSAALPGDEIVVHEGTYQEAVFIMNNVTVRSKWRRLPPLIVSAGDKPAITLRAGRATVSGLRIMQQNGECALLIAGGGSTVRDCAVSSQGCTASVRITNKAKGLFTHNTVHDGLHRAMGVWITGGATTEVCNNTISGNGECGLVAEGSGTAPSVHENMFTGGRGGGIAVLGCNPSIVKNKIRELGCSGITIDAGGDPLVEGNDICKCRGGGVLVTGEGTRGRLLNNTIYSNDDRDVFVTAKANPIVQGNHIHSGKGFGVVVCEHAAGHYEGNTIHGYADHCILVRDHAAATFVRNSICYGPTFGALVYDQAVGTFEENILSGDSEEHAFTYRTHGQVSVRANRFDANLQLDVAC
eukprot:TRINITY_DN10585_c0_g1_i1.p1 TRINITY_DN10585_c0_g1~~TRINITY_DN10585_c0_g1_i1.p1  ORF type:complete len:1158 (+),score=177.81 TRINITY_DN10585_c0_g1_i1:61-3534(+)